MRILALVVLAAWTALASQSASAQTYDPAFPFCMRVVVFQGGTYEDCSYYTLAQCQMSASGRAAQCLTNPFYASSVLTTTQKRRGHRAY
jgi:Protein of unknown function (DUF3551)